MAFQFMLFIYEQLDYTFNLCSTHRSLIFLSIMNGYIKNYIDIGPGPAGIVWTRQLLLIG